MSDVSRFDPAQLQAFSRPRHEDYAVAWLASFRSPRTIAAYRVGIGQWFGFCERLLVDPLDAARAHVDLFIHQLELDGKAPRTRNLRLTTISSFYGYLIDEEFAVRNPAKKVARSKYERRSPTAWLTRGQMYDLVTTAQELGPHPFALVSLLAYNGLRIAEACSLDVGSIGHVGFWPVIRFVRKGGEPAENSLAPPTVEALLAAIGDRTDGPLLLTAYETRMNQRAAQRILDKAVPGIRGPHGRITPHSLRHSAATLALSNGAPHDQVMHDFGWRSTSMLAHYAHGHENPARSTTHMIAANVLGVG